MPHEITIGRHDLQGVAPVLQALAHSSLITGFETQCRHRVTPSTPQEPAWRIYRRRGFQPMIQMSKMRAA